MNTIKNISALTDAELLSHYKQTNDNLVVGILYKRYTHLVLGVCLKYLKDEDEAKDSVMKIFEKLLTDLNRHEITHFKSWLHTVAKNHCMMFLRSRKGKFMQSFPDDEGGLEVVESYALQHPDGADKEEKLVLMEKGIQALNHEQRKCVELFYLQEMSYQQVAESTGYSMLQVKSYIQNGKRNLRIFMENTHER